MSLAPKISSMKISALPSGRSLIDCTVVRCIKRLRRSDGALHYNHTIISLPFGVMNPFSTATAAEAPMRFRTRDDAQQPSLAADGSSLQRCQEVLKSHYVRHGSASAHCTLMVQSNCLLHATDATFCINRVNQSSTFVPALISVHTLVALPSLVGAHCYWGTLKGQ